MSNPTGVEVDMTASQQSFKSALCATWSEKSFPGCRGDLEGRRHIASLHCFIHVGFPQLGIMNMTKTTVDYFMNVVIIIIINLN